MLDPRSWEGRTRNLRLGERVRLPHDCGEGSPILASRDEKGWHAYCFRCNDSGFKPAPRMSLGEKLARIKEQEAADAAISALPSAVLPTPQVYDLDLWPEECVTWLYKSGLSRADIGELKLYYHPVSDRVVLPVYTAGDTSLPIYWQARAVQKGRIPKYLGMTPRPPRLIAKFGKAKDVTLTEDLLSAIKVSMAEGEGWPLLGVRLTPHMLATVINRGCRVNVWLDPDGPGQVGASRVIAQLRGAGVETRRVLSEKDPKLLHVDAVKEKLKWT